MMTMPQFFFRTLLITCLGVFTYAFSSYAEEPAFNVGFLTWGGSPKVCDYQWAQLPVLVTNPTAAAMDLIVSVRAKTGAAALYSKQIKVGPGAAMRDSLDLVVELKQEYLATLSYADGRLIQKKNILSRPQNPFMAVAVYLCTDNADLEGASELMRDKTLGRRVILTRSRGERLPQRLPGFGGASVLICVDVNFERLSDLQFKAVEAFVASGGTLVVMRPKTLIDMEKTPLCDLLPVVSLGIRSIAEFPELGTWGVAGHKTPGPTWKKGIEFLEMMPEKGTVTSLRHGRFPAIVWGRHGLGNVVVMGFDGFAPGIRGREYSRLIWRHILANVGDQPFGAMAMYDKSLSQATSRLIGFKARSAGNVLAIMVAYGLLIVVLFLLGSVLKKQVPAWIGGVVCSLVLTFCVLRAAAKQLDQQDPKNAIVVDLACQTAMVNDTTGLFAGEKLINMINQSADRPDITGQSSGVWLRPQAPQPAAVYKGVKPFTMLALMEEDGHHTLKRLTVPANKPVTFFSRYEYVEGVGIPPPSLVYDKGNWRLVGGAMPGEFPGKNVRAYLLLGEGFQRVQIKKNRFVLIPEDGTGMELDLIAKDFEKFLKTARLPVPALAVFYRLPRPSSELSFGNGDYTEHRYRLHLVPVNFSVSQGDVVIPAEAVKMIPAGKGSRALRWNGVWQDAYLYRTRNEYVFSAQVPLAFRDLNLTRARVNVSIQNSSNSVRGSAELMPLSKRSTVTRETAGIPPAEMDGERMVFTGLSGHEFINPVDGKIRVKLIVNRNGDERPVRKAGRGDKWRVRDFSISLQGTLD